MAARSPAQPTHTLATYRQRLDAEMKAQGLTDRDLSAKLGEEGFPLAHTGIYRTRAGDRQPTLDECVTVAHVLGYPSLEAFLAGPAFVRITNATNALVSLITMGGAQFVTAVQEALLDVSYAVSDDEARAALQGTNPNWREEYFKGMSHDLRWAQRSQVVLWGEVSARLAEIFEVEPPQVGETKAGQ
jgi:hypothetical protein